MSQELHYTSVPRGLKPGSRGFCTVAATPGVSGPLLERLESLSAYQPVYPVHDPAAGRNPLNFMHVKPAIGGKSLSILSRVGPAGLDYSGRTNKYGHHIVLDANERPVGGPAWLLSQPGFMQEVWRGEPRALAQGTLPPQGDRPPSVARAWQALTGDAGWAGVLAEAFLADPRRTAVVLFRPGMELLPLFVEAIALLPPPRRWDVQFSTFFSTLPPGVTCSWRGVIDGSPEADAALRLPGALVINLCRPVGMATGRALVQLARTGERPDAAASRDEASTVRPTGGPVLSSTRPGVIPPSRTPTAASHETVPPLGLSGLSLQPPSLRSPQRASHNTSRVWVLVTAAAALCLVGIVATAVFLFQQDGSPKVANDDSRSQSARSTSKPKQTLAAVPKSATPGQADKKPANLVSSAIASVSASAQPKETPKHIASLTVSGPAATAVPTNGTGRDGRGAASEFVLVGPPKDPSPAGAPAAPAHPETASAMNKSTPPINRNMVLECILQEKGKESVLELPQSASGPDVVRKLELTAPKKPARTSTMSPHATTDPTDQQMLNVMATVAGAFGAKEKAVAHFKADGRKVTFNWDKAATDAEIGEAKEMLRVSILKMVTDRNEVIYALLARRPRPTSRPVEIPSEVVNAARGRRQKDLTVDVGWAVSQDPQFLYLQNRLVLLKMKAYAKGTSGELPLVEGDTPGQWICKGKTTPILMTVDIKESDNKLRFVFPQNPYLLESRIAESNGARSNQFEDLNPLHRKNTPEADLPRQRGGLENDLRLMQSLIGAQYRFVVGLRVDGKNKPVELVRVDESSQEKTP
jgi:GTPase-associated protein 1, N-terminal domain type 2/GTPase-associated protein 1, middle domain